MGVTMFKHAENELRPISENQRFAEAQEKLTRFSAKIADCRKTIDSLNRAWYGAQQRTQSAEDAIGEADCLPEAIHGRGVFLRRPLSPFPAHARRAALRGGNAGRRGALVEPHLANGECGAGRDAVERRAL